MGIAGRERPVAPWRAGRRARRAAWMRSVRSPGQGRQLGRGQTFGWPVHGRSVRDGRRADTAATTGPIAGFPGRSPTDRSAMLVHGASSARRWRRPRPPGRAARARRAHPGRRRRRPPGDHGRRRRPPSGPRRTSSSSAWPRTMATACPWRPRSTSSCATSSSTAGPKGCSLLEAVHRRAPSRRPSSCCPATARPSVVRAAIERGAAGYLDKGAEVSTIIEAIRTVAAGGARCSRPPSCGRARRPRRRPSDRELQVIEPGHGRGDQRRDRGGAGPLREDRREPSPSAVRSVRAAVADRARGPRARGGLGGAPGCAARVRMSLAFAGALVGTIVLTAALVVVRLAARESTVRRPEDALPAPRLDGRDPRRGPVLRDARRRWPGWRSSWPVPSATIDLAVLARSLRPVVDASTWRWLTVGNRPGGPVVGGVGRGLRVGAVAPARWLGAGGRWRRAGGRGRRRRSGPWPRVPRTRDAVAGSCGARPDRSADPDVPRRHRPPRSGSACSATLGAASTAHADGSPSPADAGRRRPSAVLARVRRRVAPGRTRARQAALAERSPDRPRPARRGRPGPAPRRAVAEDGGDLDRLAAMLRARRWRRSEDLGAAQHAVQLDIGGLVPALEWLAERTRSHGRTCRSRSTSMRRGLRRDRGPPRDVAAAALRVAGSGARQRRPACARCGTCADRVEAAAIRVRMTVVDDGPGLRADAHQGGWVRATRARGHGHGGGGVRGARSRSAGADASGGTRSRSGGARPRAS